VAEPADGNGVAAETDATGPGAANAVTAAPGTQATETAVDAGPLHALLLSLATRITVGAIDQLWIFPPRQAGRTESALVVVSAFEGQHDERRRILTARYLARRGSDNKVQVEESLMEHAVAPADRLPRVIDGVLRRLDDELASLSPSERRIGGDADAWVELLTSLA